MRQRNSPPAEARSTEGTVPLRRDVIERGGSNEVWYEAGGSRKRGMEVVMSWGYWGIVTGLVVLLVVFFISMEILYARARGAMGGATSSPAGNGEGAAGKKHAA